MRLRGLTWLGGGRSGRVSSPDVESCYLEILKRSLIDVLGPSTSRAVMEADGNVRIEPVPEEDRDQRMVGLDWPAYGTTMVGYERLCDLEKCLHILVDEDVPGDVIETGVWRGGAAIFMRALLDLRDDDRLVWAADSFAGLPPPDSATYPADAGDPHHTIDFLSVPLEDVMRNFARYGLSTDRVRFLEGWFRDTLPTLAGREWSLIRADGDMYESTMVALEHLYPGLASGGFVVIDDYALKTCRQAVDDFRDRFGIREPLESIDWTGVRWRKAG